MLEIVEKLKELGAPCFVAKLAESGLTYTQSGEAVGPVMAEWKRVEFALSQSEGKQILGGRLGQTSSAAIGTLVDRIRETCGAFDTTEFQSMTVPFPNQQNIDVSWTPVMPFLGVSVSRIREHEELMAFGYHVAYRPVRRA